MGDLFDILGVLGGGAGLGNVLGPIVSNAIFFTAVWALVCIGLAAALYAFDGLMLRNIGRKAGLEKDWMAFVPFARSIYRLQVIGEQWWKMFFIEYSWLYALIILWFFGLFNNTTMMTFGNVLSILYILSVVVYNLYYRNQFYKAFGLKNELALGIVTPWGVLFLTRTIDCLIAFSSMVHYGEARDPRGLGEIISQRPKPNVQNRSASCGLTGLSGMYAGQDMPIAPSDDLIIGRDASLANVIIDQNADKVSRKHCGVRFDSARNCYTVIDYSSNGTFTEGGSRLVANVPTTMQRGSVIALGSRENRFRLN
jgi:hypothetical protein